MAGLWKKIKRVALTDVGVLVKGLPTDTLEGIEQTLAEADFGPAAMDMVERLEAEVRAGRMKSEGALHNWLVDEVTALAGEPSSGELNIHNVPAPAVVVLVGVNGVGKTTQAAKLAHRIKAGGQRVLVAAADTFRAGASEQLQEWASRLDIPCVTGTSGGDPASVAYDAIESAQARSVDVVIVDTAGRQHTSNDLMTELKKVFQVIDRKHPGAPHEALLVLDGTVGQNAALQGKTFAQAVPLTGLIVTKLDGTARGGAVATLSRSLELPIRFVGTGERVEDLEPFDPGAFARRIVEG